MLGELYGQNLHSSMNVNQYKKYALLATGVVFTAEADGLTGVSIHWPFLDSPVNRGGIDFTLCIRSQTESKPVVAFNIDRDALNGKELSFNVI